MIMINGGLLMIMYNDFSNVMKKCAVKNYKSIKPCVYSLENGMYYLFF